MLLCLFGVSLLLVDTYVSWRAMLRHQCYIIVTVPMASLKLPEFKLRSSDSPADCKENLACSSIPSLSRHFFASGHSSTMELMFDFDELEWFQALSD